MPQYLITFSRNNDSCLAILYASSEDDASKKLQEKLGEVTIEKIKLVERLEI